MWLIVLLYALFSSSFVIGKVLLTYTSPIFLCGIRMALGGSILLTYQYFYAHKHFRFKMRHMKYYIQIIVFGFYLAHILRFWSLNNMPSFKACFLMNIAPFFTAFYSYLFFKEKMTYKQWGGLGIGFLGMIPMLLTSSPGESKFGEFAFISWPELSILVSVGIHTYSWIIIRKLIKDKSYSPMMVNGIGMTAGGALALLTSFLMGSFWPVSDFLPFMGLLMLTVIISNIICYNLYGYLLKSYTMTFLSFAGFISPFFGALYGWMFLKETVGWPFYVSTFFVFIGLYLFYQDELNPEKEYRDERFTE